jgi:TPR repeat protein
MCCMSRVEKQSAVKRGVSSKGPPFSSVIGKKALLLIAVLAVAGMAVIALRYTGDSHAVDPKAVSEPTAPGVDMAAFKTRADAGDPDAACKLARALVRGELGRPNYSEAARLFQMAVDKGHVEAMVGLAELYLVGRGVTNNPAEALRLYLAAAQKGNVRAIYSLAGLYEEGRGVKKDQATAAKWHQLAAERGEPLAQFNLGQRYELGLGVKPDLVEAFMWLSLASNNGIEDARDMMERLRKKLTKTQIAEATRRTEGFSPVTAAPDLTNGYLP